MSKVSVEETVSFHDFLKKNIKSLKVLINFLEKEGVGIDREPVISLPERTVIGANLETV